MVLRISLYLAKIALGERRGPDCSCLETGGFLSLTGHVQAKSNTKTSPNPLDLSFGRYEGTSKVNAQTNCALSGAWKISESWVNRPMLPPQINVKIEHFVS